MSDNRLIIPRRTLLASGGAGLLSALAAWPAVGQPTFRYSPFSLGVAAGDPAADGFVIWTRLAPEPLEVGSGMPHRAMEVDWEVASDAGFTTVVQKGKALARPELGHSVHVEVAGLEAARPYWYRFGVGGERSTAGRAKTAPAAGAAVSRVRLALAGCQHYENGYYTAHRRLAGEDLDFVYCYGDYIYEGRGARVRSAAEGPADAPR